MIIDIAKYYKKDSLEVDYDSDSGVCSEKDEGCEIK
jgi:hypothetical protein